MPKPKGLIAEIEHSIAGIPCLIGVYNYYRQEGSFNYNAPSDMDYHGYTECEWDVLDRKGYLAPWLAAKVDSREETRIDDAIAEYFS